MSAMPVEWHEEFLKNATSSLTKKRWELERLEAEVKRDAENLKFRGEQIAEAKRRGLTAFDGERLLKKAKK
jgi:hypothetical protein